MSDTEREKYPSELAERFQVRLPPGLRDRIKAAAEANNRSMNSEIVARLEASFDERSSPEHLVAAYDFVGRLREQLQAQQAHLDADIARSQQVYDAQIEQMRDYYAGLKAKLEEEFEARTRDRQARLEERIAINERIEKRNRKQYEEYKARSDELDKKIKIYMEHEKQLFEMMDETRRREKELGSIIEGLRPKLRDD